MAGIGIRISDRDMDTADQGRVLAVSALNSGFYRFYVTVSAAAVCNENLKKISGAAAVPVAVCNENLKVKDVGLEWKFPFCIFFLTFRY